MLRQLTRPLLRSTRITCAQSSPVRTAGACNGTLSSGRLVSACSMGILFQPRTCTRRDQHGESHDTHASLDSTARSELCEGA